ncbi:MAG: hypothetical protein LBH93_05735, partial [Chitinispirillales bacterium]|nr:hypothetical protein [Chitinispirillales bacterium]
MRARGCAALAFAAALASSAAAQVVVEDEIVTGSITFDIKDDGRRSLAAAMGLSLALPGVGHYYIDKPKPAFAYIAVDLASLFGAVAFNSLANAQEGNARSFAQVAAGIEKAPAGEAYWRHVGAFMDAAGYNEAVELSRGSADGQYANPENAWRWPDESLKDEYN